MSGALAKPSLLTLAPDVYSQIFSYVKVWNGIRCVTAGRQLLEHRDGIALRWSYKTFFMEGRFYGRLLKRVLHGVFAIWEFAIYLGRMRRWAMIRPDQLQLLDEPQFDYLLNSPAQVYDEWFLGALRA